MPDPKPFLKAHETQVIIDLMVSRLPDKDAFVTYRELEQVTGRSLARIRGNISSACKFVLDEHGKHFRCDRGFGYRLCPDEELPDCGKERRKKARTQFRKSLKIMAVANPTKQSRGAFLRTVQERTIAELGMATTAPRTIDRAEQMVARSQNELTLEEQVQLIKDSLERKP